MPSPSASSNESAATLQVREGLYARINKSLTTLAVYLKLNSAQNFNTTSVILEDTCVRLLNLIYGLELTNLNAEAANAPAADLIDRTRRVAYQITIKDTTEKIRETHRKAFKHELARVMDTLTIFFFWIKAPNEPDASGNFTPCTSPTIKTLDIPGLLMEIHALSIAEMRAVVDLLEEEINLKLPKGYNPFPSLQNLPADTLGERFIGRGDFLDSLYDGLSSREMHQMRGRQVIHGMGGVGKTRAAVEYALAYAPHYTALLFISADTPETLTSHFAALWETLNLPLTGEATTNVALQEQAVRQWLKSNAGWLLVIDNVDTGAARQAVRDLTTSLTNGHLLFTSRLTTWPQEFSMQRLGVLDQEQSIALLVRHTEGSRIMDPAHDDASAASLAEELGGLALALEQAAAYIREKEMSFQQYLSLWQQSRSQLLAQYSAMGADDYHRDDSQEKRSLFVTFQISVDQVPQPAQQLLQVLSWLAPDPFPTQHLSMLEEIPQAASMLTSLTKFHLATRTPDGQHCSVHRVLQDITRLRQTGTPPPMLFVALEWINDAFEHDASDPLNWHFLVPILPHALTCATHAEEHRIACPTSILLNQAGVLFHSQAQYCEAEPLFNRALALDEAFFGKHHTTVAIRLNNLAQFLFETNRLHEAEPLMRRALAIDENSEPPDPPQVALDLNNLAQLLQDTHREEEAELLMRRALAIDEATIPPDLPKVATDLNNLAQLLHATNRHSEAESMMRRALAMDKAHFGPDHPTVAIRLNNLARLLQDTDRLEDAEPLMRRALEILEQSPKAKHPDTIDIRKNLAALHKQMGK